MARAGLICSEVGCPEPAVYRGRCRAHATEAERREKRTTPTKIAGKSTAERRRRARAVAQWKQRYGNVCPGYGRPPHEADDLTAQHAAALALGGSVDQALVVLCRECNSRHGLAVRRARNGELVHPRG